MQQVFAVSYQAAPGAGKEIQTGGAVSLVAVVAIALREVSLESNRRSGAVRGPRGGLVGGPKGVRGALKGVEVPPESGSSARPQERKCGWKVVLQSGTGV